MTNQLTFKENLEEMKLYENDKYLVYFDTEDKVVRFAPKKKEYPRIGEMNGIFDVRAPGMKRSILVEDFFLSSKGKYDYVFDLIKQVKELKPIVIG